MSFDKPTRNLLAKMTAAARDRLAEDITAQLQTSYGLYPDGSRLDVAQQPEDRHAAAELRALLDHFESAEPEGKQRKANAYQRLVREIGFTLLNRLAALRLCEERGLVVECVRVGMNSAGFQLYDRLAGGALGNRYHTYRAFLACMFDELAADLGALFDRSTPQSAVFPSEPALNDVLALLNDTELASRKIWQQDETIGWIYQYYNDPAERKKMRDESQAPRNSRELAVRNQFFTPRYVVEFLTDNTLGRTWYEMRQGQTKLTEQCRYLVQRRHPIFLAEGQEAPAPFDPATSPVDPDLPGEMWVRPNPELESISELFTYALTVGGYDYAHQVLNIECSELANSRREQYAQTGKWEGSFEELRCCLFFEQRRYHHFGRGPEGEDAQAITNLHKTICEQWDREVDLVPFRAKKDPRRLRVLDPACGSGHFLLYAFDLLETIYAEVYDDPDLGADLQDAFPNRADFSRQVPRLILENNLHGIDIDPRAAQIAALALWLRAQRAWQAQKLSAAERPQIGRTHIVVAEPMPGDEGLLEEFIADLPKDQHPEIIGPLVRTVFEKMKLAGEAGSLLKIEEELKEAIERARVAWSRVPQPKQLSFLPGQPKPKQLGLNLSGVTDESYWQQAEELVLGALEGYAGQAENGQGIRRRLFAGDAAQGFAFIDLCLKNYDAVLMNPPFGEFSEEFRDLSRDYYQSGGHEILAAFIERGIDLSKERGFVGAISSRTVYFQSTTANWRKNVILPIQTHLWAELGSEVLDTAVVETVVYTLEKRHSSQKSIFIGVRKEVSNEDRLKVKFGSEEKLAFLNTIVFSTIKGQPFSYWLHPRLFASIESFPTIEQNDINVRVGLQTGDDFRFIRLFWEVSPDEVKTPQNSSGRWVSHAKGGDNSPYAPDIHLVVNWRFEGKEILAYPSARMNMYTQLNGNKNYLRPGLTFSYRTSRFSPSVMPANCITGVAGMGIFSNTNNLYFLAAYLNSSIVNELITARSGLLEINSLYQAGIISPTPYPSFSSSNFQILSDLGQSLYESKALLFSIDETTYYYKIVAENRSLTDWANSLIQKYEQAISSVVSNYKKVDLLIANRFGINSADQNLEEILNRWTSKLEECLRLDNLTITNLASILISHLFGITLGRWDIRYTKGGKLLSKIDPVAPLPKCLSVMHQETNLNLAESPEGFFDEYPILFPVNGILSDDPGLGDHSEFHEWDIMKRLEVVFQFLWPENHESIKAEVCHILEVNDLREYFRKPSGFFADHLKRYSKSRRQAPIYWPLSTPSGSYNLWIYYQCLNSETLYTAVNRFVSPKIEQVERYLGKLEEDLAKVFGRSAGELRDKVDSTRAFLVELNEFRAELLRVANLPYQPDLNDGVIINAAPLYKLFRLTKWSKDCQAVWEKLEAGEYDWAHMAYVLWPDRVREKCKKDKSLAIAHGLEELYQGEEKGKKGKRKKQVTEEQEGLGF